MNVTTSSSSRSVGEELRAREQRIVDIVTRKFHERTAARDQQLTTGQRVADAVAATMGSWRFIIVQSVLLAAWIVLNVTELIFHAWDPYPFILLNLALSFQAAYAAPIIMMSQNRQSTKDREQADLDLRTDLKAETLIEELHGGIDDLRLQKWSELLSIQQQQIELMQSMLKHLEARSAAS